MRDLHPPLPQGSVLPGLPQHAPEMILEDDTVMHALLRRSNNGSASGQSGWGGNMLSMLVESDVCFAGIIALLRDIINGKLPDSARQLLLASRAIGLGKPPTTASAPSPSVSCSTLAGVIAVRRIAMTARELLAPHQYGMGVANGAERILHSLQHALTDKETKTALLRLDISNAFNSCDRARTPRRSSARCTASPTSATPHHASYCCRAVRGNRSCRATGYARATRYQRCCSACTCAMCWLAWVRQRRCACTNCLTTSTWRELLLKALAALKEMLADISLKVNTSKSHFAYFHRDEEPLPRSILQTLADNDIQRHERHFETVGAVVGCDEDAIREGLDEMIAGGRGRDAFFTRVVLPDLSAQSSMLLLRQCAVPPA